MIGGPDGHVPMCREFPIWVLSAQKPTVTGNFPRSARRRKELRDGESTETCVDETKVQEASGGVQVRYAGNAERSP